AALAQDSPAEHELPILAVIDARMGEVYAGAFRRAASGLVEPIGDETVGHAGELVVPTREDWCVVGSGWSVYRGASLSRLPREPRHADGARYPQAHAVARLAAPKFAAGHAVAPEAALPVYLRDKVALTLEEQRAR